MNWQQICEDPQLRNLPYKIELNETGQLIMTPARLIHGAYQARIVRILAKILQYNTTYPEIILFCNNQIKSLCAMSAVNAPIIHFAGLQLCVPTLF